MNSSAAASMITLLANFVATAVNSLNIYRQNRTKLYVDCSFSIDVRTASESSVLDMTDLQNEKGPERETLFREVICSLGLFYGSFYNILRLLK